MDLSLQLAESLLRQRIRDTVTLKIGKRNGVGIMFYNTRALKLNDPADDESTSSTDISDQEEDDETTNVHVLLALEPPGIQQVKLVRQCIAKEHRNIQTEFASTHNDTPYTAPLQIALEEAIRMFRQATCVRDRPSKPNDPVDSRSIWILTNREQPYSAESQGWIQNVAGDAKEQGIQIIVWPLGDASLPFAMDPFYREIVSYEAFEERLSSMEAIQDGLELLQPQWKKVRRIYYGPMWLPGDHTLGDEGLTPIMVDWFRLVQMAKKPARVQIDQATNRYVQLEFIVFCSKDTCH